MEQLLTFTANGYTFRLPALNMTVNDQVFLFCPLLFVSILQAVLPWHCKLHDDDVLSALRDQEDVGPQGGPV